MKTCRKKRETCNFPAWEGNKPTYPRFSQRRRLQQSAFVLQRGQLMEEALPDLLGTFRREQPVQENSLLSSHISQHLLV